MQSCLPQLVNALSGKRASMEELLLILQNEQRSIIDIDLDSLTTLEGRKKELLTAIERNNAECRLLFKEASLELNLDKVENLTPIISVAPPPVCHDLKGLQTKLRELGHTMKQLLDFNKELLEGSLSHMRESITFFNSVMQRQGSTYGYAGNMLDSGNKVRLVCKEI